MALSTHDDWLDASSDPAKGLLLDFSKASIVITGGEQNSLWTYGPNAGAFPTLGAGNGRVCDKTTAGALAYRDASGGRTLMVASGLYFPMYASGPFTDAGTLYIVDRIADVQIANALAGSNTAITGLDATSRLASGEGAQILIEVSSALSAASNNRTFKYHNQDGTSGQVTQALVTRNSAAATLNPANDSTGGVGSLWLPLADGDVGVRSVESTTLVSGSATGSLVVALVRPICKVTVNGLWWGHLTDYVLRIPCSKKIYPNSCLMGILIANSSVNPGWCHFGITTVEG